MHEVNGCRLEKTLISYTEQSMFADLLAAKRFAIDFFFGPFAIDFLQRLSLEAAYLLILYRQ